MSMLCRVALISLVAVVALAACSQSQAPNASPSAPAAQSADLQQAKALTLYRQMLQLQSWELAAPIGQEIVQKWPGSEAATEVNETLADAVAKGSAIATKRRLTALWMYQSGKEFGGDQVTASIYSSDLVAVDRVRLIMRRHSQWGESVYLFGAGKGFDCPGACSLDAEFDGKPQKLAAYLPDTGEPALFIKDDKAFIARLGGVRKFSVKVGEKGKPPRTLVFEVGGYDAAKFPQLAKSK